MTMLPTGHWWHNSAATIRPPCLRPPATSKIVATRWISTVGAHRCAQAPACMQSARARASRLRSAEPPWTSAAIHDQGIARRGHYGAFLLDEPDLIISIVRTLSRGLTIPVFVKIRVQPSLEDTLALARGLQDAGCSLLTVHGRTREQKTGCVCDWEAIATVKRALSIPVLANGGIERPEDVQRCLDATGCEGVMTSEAALENPAMLGGVPTSRTCQAAVTREYVALARAHPPRTVAILKAHLFKLLFVALEIYRDLRERLGSTMDAEAVFAVADEACAREEAQARLAPEEMNARCDLEGAPHVSWYRRHRSSPQQAKAAAD